MAAGEQSNEPLADVAKPDARSSGRVRRHLRQTGVAHTTRCAGRGRRQRPRVPDFHAERVPRDARVETHTQWTVAVVASAVLDGVLEQRVNQKRRDRARLRCRLHVRLDGQPLLEANLLDREIPAERIQLRRERRRLQRALHERVPQERGELRHHLPSPRTVLVDHRPE